MGIDTAAASFLLAARAYGVDFSDTATLGRQDFFAREERFRKVAQAFGIGSAKDVIEHCGPSGDKYLEFLGAKSVTSFDASPYEKATVIHDMNQPLPPEYRGRFSAVFDGGTMEHVFDARQFYRNALDMVRPGGHYLCLTCGNNMVGHGFYQFSPEFFYQTLTPENGFTDTVVMHCVFQDAPPPFYAIAEPRRLGARVELVNTRPLYIFAISRRTEVKPLFTQTPQQSDYVVAWKSTPPTAPSDKPVMPGGPHPLAKFIPQPMRPVIKRLFATNREGGFRQTCFQRLTLDDLVHGKLQHPLNR